MPDENKNDSLKLKLLGPVAAAAGATLQDAWELVFGGFGNYVEKKRMERKKALEDFKATLEGKVNSIPSNQLCEPPLSVIGPALEASKYYFEEKELRDMFASVISASMDTRVASRVHPSFPTIIQQLSSIDAQNLACFHSAGALPICEYQIDVKQTDPTSEKSFRVSYTNVFLANSQIHDLNKAAVSIAVLSRLGLIEVAYDRTLIIADYQIFEETAEFKSLISKCKENSAESPHIQKGVALLTPLGEQLCSICFSDPPQSDS